MALKFTKFQCLIFSFLAKRNRLVILACFLLMDFSIENINAQCVAKINKASPEQKGCDAFPVLFKDGSTGNAKAWNWNFGDGFTVSGPNPATHKFIGNGRDTSYFVSLKVTCGDESESIAYDTITVYAKPRISFSALHDSACAFFGVVDFVNTSDSILGYTYDWDFGDLSTHSTNYNTSHIYSSPGKYTVTQRVVTGRPCPNELIKTDMITVIPAPNPNFSYSPSINLCNPQSITFKNITDTISLHIASWTWDFGDNTPVSHSSNPVHVYRNPGTYSVKLSATNALGCSNITPIQITIRTMPGSTFTVNSPVCLGDTNLLTYSGTAGVNASYTWDFAGATVVSGSASGPYKVVWGAGTKLPALTVIDSSCTSITTNPVTINNRPQVVLSVPSNIVCDEQNVTFTALPLGAVAYNFYINSVLKQSSASNIFQTTTLNSRDSVFVTSNSSSCPSLPSNKIEITEKPATSISLFVEPNDSVCSGDSVTYRASPSGYDTYQLFDVFELLKTKTDSSFKVVLNAKSATQQKAHLMYVVGKNSCGTDTSNVIKTRIMGSRATVVNGSNTCNPVICDTSSSDKIKFTWSSAGVPAYTVSVNINNGGWSGPTSPSSGSNGLSHLLTGLNSGDSAAIVVQYPQVQFCGARTVYMDTIVCYAKPCTGVKYNLNGCYNSYCKNDAKYVKVTKISTKNFEISYNGAPPTIDTIFKVITDTNLVSVVLRDLDQPGCQSIRRTSGISTYIPPVVALSVSADTICKGDSLMVSASPTFYDNYTFFDGVDTIQNGPNPTFYSSNFQNGNYIYVIAKNFQCYTDTSVKKKLAVLEKIQNPQPNCGISTDNSISFTWLPVPKATSYQISLDGSLSWITPSSGSLGTTHLITGLNSGDAATILVRSLNSGKCGVSTMSAPATCVALPCTPPNFKIEPYHKICEGDSIQLSIKDLNVLSYSISWNEEPGQTNTFYKVRPLGDSIVKLKVTDNDQPISCRSVNNFFDLTFVPKPKVELTSSDLNDSICKKTFITFTATPLTPPFIYQGYDFIDRFSLLQNSASNQFSTTSLVNGNSVYIIPSNDGCIGDTSNRIITHVSDPLKTPQVNCGVTTDSSIIFTWDSIIGASGYIVSVDGGAFITPSSGAKGLSHTLIDIPAKGDARSISVIALGAEPCGNSLASVTTKCFAYNCTPPIFAINPYQAICENDPINLCAVLLYPLDSSYNVFWNKATIGTLSKCFSVKSAIDTLIYISIKDTTQSTCIPTTKYFDLTVNPKPISTLTSSAIGDSICIGESVSFFAPALNYLNYSFYKNNLLVRSSSNPVYKTSALKEGDIIKVITSTEDCSSDTSNSIKIKVFSNLNAPQVNCGTSNDSTIIFTWFPVQGAKNYMVSINGGGIFTEPSSGASGLSHSISGLKAGDTRTIIVKAIGFRDCQTSLTSSPVTCAPLGCAVGHLTTPQVNCGVTTDSTIQFTWDPVVNAVGYLVSVDGGTFVSPHGLSTDNFELIHNLSPGQSSKISVVALASSACGNSEVSSANTCSAIPCNAISFNVNLFDTVCGGNMDTIKVKNIIPSSYNISFDGGALTTKPDYALLVNSSNVISVSVYDTSHLNCRAVTKYVNINAKILPGIGIMSSSPGSICKGSSLNFTATPGGLFNYKFYNKSFILQNSSGNTFNTDKLTSLDSIYVIASNSNGCSGKSANTIVTAVKPAVHPKLRATPEGLCIGGLSVINATLDTVISGTTLLWNTTATTSSISVSPSLTSTYYVDAIINTCSFRDSLQLEVDDLFTAKVAADTTVCDGDSMVINLTPYGNRYTYQWSPVSGLSNASIANPMLSPTATITYKVNIGNPYCFSQDSITIIFDKCLSNLDSPVPQVITPNEDGENDKWIIPDIDYFANNSVVIYNRWGNEVYAVSPYDNKNPWNGTSRGGDLLPDGMYYYIIDLGTRVKHIVGYVLIHR